MTTTLPTTDMIDVTQLRALQLEDPQLRILDVRTGAEFETAHIPGSYNVPLDTLGEHATDLASVLHPVVLVCQSGGRATRAHQELSAAGKSTLHILEGGIAKWQQAGGEVALGDSDRWAMDRQVRMAAGSISMLGVLASRFLPGTKWIAGGVGAGLAFSAVSNTCAMAQLLGKLPYNQSSTECDIAGVLDQMNRAGASGPTTT